MRSLAIARFINRRRFLGLSGLLGVLGAAGCGESGPQTITTPPTIKGNRTRLDMLKEKAAQGAEKQKAKSK